MKDKSKPRCVRLQSPHSPCDTASPHCFTFPWVSSVYALPLILLLQFIPLPPTSFLLPESNQLKMVSCNKTAANHSETTNEVTVYSSHISCPSWVSTNIEKDQILLHGRSESQRGLSSSLWPHRCLAFLYLYLISACCSHTKSLPSTSLLSQ